MNDPKAQRILVVETELVLKSALLEILIYEGYAAVGAPSWEDGLLKARESHPALVIADAVPRECYGAIQSLRSDPTTHDIRFLLTCKCAEKMEVEALFGPHDFLLRAYFTPEEFFEVVNKVLT